MPRIKFLDVLEETKSKPIYNSFDEDKTTSNFHHEPQNSFINNERIYRPEYRSEKFHPHTEHIPRIRDPKFISERNLLKETNISSDNDNLIRPDSIDKSIWGLNDYRLLWTGILFILFGGLLFLSGYWFGKSVTDHIKLDDKSDLQNLSYMKEELHNGTDNIPEVEPQEYIPHESIKVIEPAVIPESLPKKVPKNIKKSVSSQSVKKTIPVLSKKVQSIKKGALIRKDYVIQISAHSTIESARVVEDLLRKSGYSVYISENVIGDSIFFRVRVRGFSTLQEAQAKLKEIKSRGFGVDGFVLSL